MTYRFDCVSVYMFVRRPASYLVDSSFSNTFNDVFTTQTRYIVPMCKACDTATLAQVQGHTALNVTWPYFIPPHIKSPQTHGVGFSNTAIIGGIQLIR